VRANVLQARGDLEAGRGHLQAAQAWYEQALPLYEQTHDALGLSNVLAELAQVHWRAGRPDQAARGASDALALAARCGNRYAEQLALRVFTFLGREDPSSSG
jgi:tetratricopeptide (TPR) repeat protein